MRRRAIAILLAIGSLAGILGVGVATPAPAGAQSFYLVNETFEWFLGGSRACLLHQRFHNEGSVNIRMACYNNAWPTPQLVMQRDSWHKDYFHTYVEHGNGAGISAKVRTCRDSKFSPNPEPNLAGGAPFYADDIYATPAGQNGAQWVDTPGTNPDGQWHGQIWWDATFNYYTDITSINGIPSYDGCLDFMVP